VYITHPHADHFLGLPEILAAFPEARPVALAESIPAMEEQISPGSRTSWARALDAVAALEAGTVIAGHRNPLAAALERSSAPAA